MSNLLDFEQHPLSAAFPPMSDRDFAELCRDVARSGLRHAITLFVNQILDGWHRYQACREPRFTDFDGDEAAARRFVISANLARRHLDAGQRAMLAARLAPLPHRRSQIRSRSCSVFGSPPAIKRQICPLKTPSPRRPRCSLSARARLRMPASFWPPAMR